MDRQHHNNSSHILNNNLYPIVQTSIDILISVVDNYGDMGFAMELILAFEQQFPGKYAYHIWTNSPLVVSDFFASNKFILPQYSIQSIDDFGKEVIAPVTLALFHMPLPEFVSHSPQLIFRIDYLSLDSDWVCFHGSEYIHSTETLPIIEIIPSPLAIGGGLTPMAPQKYSRADLAERFDLDLYKRWVTVFMYSETQANACIFEDIPDDVAILLLGHQEMYPENIHPLPWLDILTFHDILRESDWSIVRGEVSFANALALGKPFFWDMYKERGGFPTEQSEQFLGTITDTKYHDLHLRLNRQKEGQISFIELDQWVNMQRVFPIEKYLQKGNLIIELQKHIDRFGFSI